MQPSCGAAPPGAAALAASPASAAASLARCVADKWRYAGELGPRVRMRARSPAASPRAGSPGSTSSSVRLPPPLRRFSLAPRCRTEPKNLHGERWLLLPAVFLKRYHRIPGAGTGAAHSFHFVRRTPLAYPHAACRARSAPPMNALHYHVCLWQGGAARSRLAHSRRCA